MVTLSEILLEAATDVLFHYRSLNGAYKILTGKKFLLSSAVGNKSELDLAPRKGETGYIYYLSLTRSKTGAYHDYVGDSAVMFVISGRKLSQKYPVGPIDYWGSHVPLGKKESEDRLWSKTASVPIDSIQEAHLFINPNENPNEQKKSLFRKTAIAAKQNNISVYFYTDELAWRNLNKNKSHSIKNISNILSAQDTTEPRPAYPTTRYLKPYLELLLKPLGKELSKKADNLRYNIKYAYDISDAANGLEADMFNSRKPSSRGYDDVVKLNNIMKKLKLSTPREVVSYIQKKYSQETL
jgi:hypothetical protein